MIVATHRSDAAGDPTGVNVPWGQKTTGQQVGAAVVLSPFVIVALGAVALFVLGGIESHKERARQAAYDRQRGRR
jgi:hypothetical protein